MSIQKENERLENDTLSLILVERNRNYWDSIMSKGGDGLDLFTLLRERIGLSGSLPIQVLNASGMLKAHSQSNDYHLTGIVGALQLSQELLNFYNYCVSKGWDSEKKIVSNQESEMILAELEQVSNPKNDACIFDV